MQKHSLKFKKLLASVCFFSFLFLLLNFSAASAQNNLDEENNLEQSDGQEISLSADAGAGRKTLIDKQIAFEAELELEPAEANIDEILWDFGDGTRTTGNQVTHSYSKAGSYLVRLTVTAADQRAEDTLEVKVFDQGLVLLADQSVSSEQVELFTQQAAEEDLLLQVLRSKSGGPGAVVEEELSQLLLSAQEDIKRAEIVAVWTSGNIGANALSRFAQDVKQTGELVLADLGTASLGVVVLSETPFAVLSPTAQATFDQLQPAYVLLSRPDALPLLFSSPQATAGREAILASPIDHKLLGTFSSRAVADLGITNFMSFGINYLVNNGIPVNNILLVLMIPVIATILAFARQVIGIKAFGIITPAMTTLSFLVLGLVTGLIVFVVVLLSGTLTRIVLRRFRLLYLPRMALVLTSASLAILVMFAVTAAIDQVASLSFSVFPILILTILAEEFIAVQFNRGAKFALKTTAWTLLLTIICYGIVSWQLIRTLLLSYPEIVLLAIPLNIALGRFAGLRVTEYIRFRELIRHGSTRS